MHTAVVAGTPLTITFTLSGGPWTSGTWNRGLVSDPFMCDPSFTGVGDTVKIGATSQSLPVITGSSSPVNYHDTTTVSAGLLALIPSSGTLSVTYTNLNSTSLVSESQFILNLTAGSGGGGKGHPNIHLWFKWIMEAMRLGFITRKISDRLQPATFPCAYQVTGMSEINSDFLFVSPGRFIDGINSFNQDVGMRIFADRQMRDGWNTTGYVERSDRPEWTMPADAEAIIPWTGFGNDIIIEFFRDSGTTGAAAKIEFTLLAYKG